MTNAIPGAPCKLLQESPIKKSMFDMFNGSDPNVTVASTMKKQSKKYISGVEMFRSLRFQVLIRNNNIRVLLAALS